MDIKGKGLMATYLVVGAEVAEVFDSCWDVGGGDAPVSSCPLPGPLASPRQAQRKMWANNPSVQHLLGSMSAHGGISAGISGDGVAAGLLFLSPAGGEGASLSPAGGEGAGQAVGKPSALALACKAMQPDIHSQ